MNWVTLSDDSLRTTTRGTADPRETPPKCSAIVRMRFDGKPKEVRSELIKYSFARPVPRKLDVLKTTVCSAPRPRAELRPLPSRSPCDPAPRHLETGTQ